jgi:outer membrane protein assembly factor BamD
MTQIPSDVRRRVSALAGVFLLVVSAGGCGKKVPRTPQDPSVADQFLLQRGQEELAKKHWMDAREFFRQILDNYSSSPLRAQARLLLADSYLGEGSTEALVLAANEYREFLAFYPTDPKDDHAQYSIAMSYFKQMKNSDRDQTNTSEALAEFGTFFERFPNSPLTADAQEKWRVARDRLSEATFGVGVTYFKGRWYPGAVDRFNDVIKNDPSFTHIDAVYYYLAESYARVDRKAEAIPLFDRVTGYKSSEYAGKAQKRLQDLTAQ